MIETLIVSNIVLLSIAIQWLFVAAAFLSAVFALLTRSQEVAHD